MARARGSVVVQRRQRQSVHALHACNWRNDTQRTPLMIVCAHASLCCATHGGTPTNHHRPAMCRFARVALWCAPRLPSHRHHRSRSASVSCMPEWPPASACQAIVETQHELTYLGTNQSTFDDAWSDTASDTEADIATMSIGVV